MEISNSAATNTVNTTVNNTIKYRDINDFLSKHFNQKNTNTTNPKPTTNTRIRDDKLNIRGGSYTIPDEEYELFLKLYAEDVIINKKKEYLTEKQLINDGPLLVDIDFRYDYDIDEKQHTFDDIIEIIGAYLDIIQDIYQLDDDNEFPIYIFEKPTVNRVEKDKKTKDGIHMLFGLKVDRITQKMIREKIIIKASEIWEKLPLKNSWDDIFDKSITNGSSGWQLYGSRKPGFDKYQLTHIFQAKWTGLNFIYPEIPLSSFDISKNLYKLSARNKDNLTLFMKNQFIKEYEQYKIINRIDNSSDTTTNVSQNLNAIVRVAHLDIYNCDFLNPSIISTISSKQELDNFINKFLDSIQISEYNLREIYDYTMILPSKYYDDYDKWIRVGWALRNTDNRLLLTWIAFSAKSTKFHYSDIHDNYDRWFKFKNNEPGLTKNSLIYWAKTDNFKEYEGIRNKTIDYFLEKTIRSNNINLSKTDDRSGCGDTDIAKVLYEVYKHMFVCTSVKNNDWYQYNENRWFKVDSGTTLRKAISEKIHDLYNDKSTNFMVNTVFHGDNKENLEEQSVKRAKRILSIMMRLNDCNSKDKIMKEARELFYDNDFLQKLDQNPELLCFKNGVIDFKEKVFRKGKPEDCISMSTHINYIPLNPSIHQPIIDQINDFMNKLFPVKELCEYMWII